MAKKDAEPPPLVPSTTTRFEKDVKLQAKRGKDLSKLRDVIETLCARLALETKHRDHALMGDWKGWRDCHIEPDWLLIYQTTGTELVLGRMGTHADLFE